MSLTFDTGALIAVDRDDRRIALLLSKANARKVRVAVPVGVLGQAWRDGRTQSLLAKFLKSKLVELVALDALTARRAGELCGRAGTADVIDASVVLCAKSRNHRVVTSDPDDISRLDPKLALILI